MVAEKEAMPEELQPPLRVLHHTTHTHTGLPRNFNPLLPREGEWAGPSGPCSPACSLLKVTPMFSFPFPHILDAYSACRCTKHPLNTSIFHVDIQHPPTC